MTDNINRWEIHDPVFEAGPVAYDPLEKWEAPDFKGKGLWYFWDETWANWHGPFPNEKAARDALDLYAENMLGVKR